MDDIIAEFEGVKVELINYYRNEFSSPAVCYTLPVSQREVEIVKQLIGMVGGKEAHEVLLHCWNVARVEYPKMCQAVLPDFPFCREGWRKR